MSIFFSRSGWGHLESKGDASVQWKAFNWVMHCTVSTKGGVKTVDAIREKSLELFLQSKSDSFLLSQ